MKRLILISMLLGLLSSGLRAESSHSGVTVRQQRENIRQKYGVRFV